MNEVVLGLLSPNEKKCHCWQVGSSRGRDDGPNSPRLLEAGAPQSEQMELQPFSPDLSLVLQVVSEP